LDLSPRHGIWEDRGSGEEVWLAVAEKGEKEGAVGWRRGMTGGPGLSAGERGEGRRWPAGLRPRKEGGGAGWAQRRRGGRKKVLPFSFSSKFSK